MSKASRRARRKRRHRRMRKTFGKMVDPLGLVRQDGPMGGLVMDVAGGVGDIIGVGDAIRAVGGGVVGDPKSLAQSKARKAAASAGPEMMPEMGPQGTSPYGYGGGLGGGPGGQDSPFGLGGMPQMNGGAGMFQQGPQATLQPPQFTSFAGPQQPQQPAPGSFNSFDANGKPVGAGQWGKY